MKIKSIATALSVVFILGAMAVPALADTTAVGVILRGAASVGQSFDGDCTKDSNPGVQGNGLHLPGVDPSTYGGVYSLAVPPGTLAGVDNHGHAAASGSLNVCGLLAPVGPIGAACGISNGNSGVGKAELGPHTINLTNVGWATSAGGTLPVEGDTEERPKEGKVGKLYALIQAQGGSACINSDGAKTFSVDGVWTIING